MCAAVFDHDCFGPRAKQARLAAQTVIATDADPISAGVSVLLPSATIAGTIDLTGSNSAQLKPIFIEGERVRKIEVGANFGGASDVVYVTESGKRVRLE